MKFLLKYLPLFLLFILSVAHAQSFKIYKGDTINKLDSKGLKQGVWMKFDKNNKRTSEGKFLNNVRIGKFKSFNEDGKLQAERTYGLDGKKSRMTVFYDGGKIRAKGNLIEEMKDSTWLYYNDLGTLVSEEFYVKGSSFLNNLTIEPDSS